MDIQHN